MKLPAKYYLFMLWIFSSQIILAQNDWYVINTETTRLINGVKFFNNQVGYAVGDSGLVLKSTNAGSSWSQINLWNGYRFYDVAFSDINTAVSVGTTNNGSMVRTTNGGFNWNSLGLFFEPVGFYHIQFVNQNTAYALGGPFSVYKSINAGQNWSIVMRNTGYNLASLQFSSDSIGYCGGTAPINPIRAVILKTTNYGTNWAEINTGILGFWVIDMAFLNDQLGYITVGNKIYKTTNGAGSWTLSYTTNMLNSIYFLNSNTGFAAGDGGVIVKTTNGGTSWFQMTTGVGNNIRDIYFINENTGIAIGSNGLLLRTTSSLSGVNIISNEIPTSHYLFQNYPNPFNPVTKIKFALYKSSKISVIIYDLKGSLVETLVNDQLNAGNYEVDFDGSKYSSGVYYYKLVAGDYTDTKKMVLIK